MVAPAPEIVKRFLPRIPIYRGCSCAATRRKHDLALRIDHDEVYVVSACRSTVNDQKVTFRKGFRCVHTECRVAQDYAHRGIHAVLFPPRRGHVVTNLERGPLIENEHLDHLTADGRSTGVPFPFEQLIADACFARIAPIDHEDGIVARGRIAHNRNEIADHGMLGHVHTHRCARYRYVCRGLQLLNLNRDAMRPVVQFSGQDLQLLLSLVVQRHVKYRTHVGRTADGHRCHVAVERARQYYDDLATHYHLVDACHRQIPLLHRYLLRTLRFRRVVF